MTASRFYVWSNGDIKGPFVQDELCSLVNKKHFYFEDFLCDLSSKEKKWVMIGQHELFSFLCPDPPSESVEIPNIYLYSKNKISGPYITSEVVEKLRSKEVSLFEYFFRDRIDKDWIKFINHPLFSHLVPAPPKESILREEFDSKKSFDGEDVSDRTYRRSKDSFWYLYKGSEEVGPFSYFEMVEMLQKKILNEKSEIKRKGSERKGKLALYPEFDSIVVRKYFSDSAEFQKKSFLNRKHKRSSFFAPVRFVYDGKVYQGTCSSLSEGGLFIEMKPGILQVGNTIEVKVLPGGLPLSFDAEGEIVSVAERNPQGIGVRFLEISDKFLNEIKDFLEKF